MKKIASLITAILLLAIPLTACQRNNEQVITGSERDKIIAIADPIEDNLLNGIKSGDYATFSKDFDPAMKKAFLEPDLVNLRYTFSTKMGVYQSREVSSVLSATANNQTHYIVIYTLHFTKYQALTHRLVLTNTPPYQIAGLWYNFPQLGQ